ncbi:HAMP domain-containing sensor histidine kinase [Archangium violaceum]|uniref:sensor histidine kinase n=1 Tax=Archangium violaceum TaxID=83451 RepID=UPI002B2CAED6|nr:HAMP domain-containing sensor histidine kinase [Archangium gephyra]
MRPRDTLVRRISRTMLAIVLMSSALAAGATGVLADRMLLASEDRRLRNAAVDLVHEVAGLGEAEAGREADAEQAELERLRIRITLFAGNKRLGGAPDIPAQSGCGWSTAPGEEWVRRCGEEAPGLLAVAEERFEGLPQLRGWLTMAALVTAAGALLMGLAMSRRMARWAARPLTELSESLALIQPGTPLPSPLGTPARYAEVNAVRTSLVELLGRLQEALEQSRRFSANAAHELRTPLATLRAELELLAEEGHPPGTAAALARLHRTVTALGTLVERLLVLAEGARGTLDLTETVSLPEIAEDVLLSLPEGDRGRIRIEVEGKGFIQGDAHLLRQLVDNAVDNALKFSGKGHVRVSIQETAEATLLEVRDEGPGIAREDSARVFEPFYRSPTARAGHPGHGIGLSLVALVARTHRARAEFLPAVRGAHLRVSFPHPPAPPEPASTGVDAENKPAGEQ